MTGDDILFQKPVEKFDIDFLDAARKEPVHPADDAERMRDDGIGVRRAQIVGGEAFEDFVRHAIGDGEGDIERLRVGDARVPSALLMGMSACFANSRIWCAAPWTMTSRMLRERSTARSSMMLGKLSSAMMAPPSRAITNVFSRKPGM